jgi:hypothetical protein
MLGPEAWYQDHRQLHWTELPDESLCRAYIQFSLMKMCHQQKAMDVLLQGVANGLVLKGLLVSGPRSFAPSPACCQNDVKHSSAEHTRPVI